MNQPMIYSCVCAFVVSLIQAAKRFVTHDTDGGHFCHRNAMRVVVKDTSNGRHILRMIIQVAVPRPVLKQIH
jgi:hypothetical protein